MKPESQPLQSNQSGYRWFILALLTAIGAFAVALPASCMPPLFKEMSADLGMDLVQIGSIWGIASLAGLFVSIPGGILSDRLNNRLFIGISCLLVGVTGALRGLSDSFLSLAMIVFLNGIIRCMLPIATTKIIGLWFKGKNLGMAQGIGAMGMGLGLTAGPLLSATVLSPWLGGWRNVMYFYGAVAALLGILWLIFGRQKAETDSSSEPPVRIPVGTAISRVFRNKYVWFLAFTLFFRIACLVSVTGYIPTYLKNIGWSEGSADGVLAVLYAVSALMVVPLSTLSDKIGTRKPIMFIGLIAAMLSVGLIPFVDGAGIWVLVITAGFLLDGFMALFAALLLETEGVGPALSGTAIGVTYTIAQLGGSVAPPVGNSLDVFGHQWPFLFWAFMGLLALIPFLFVKETGKRLKHH